MEIISNTTGSHLAALIQMIGQAQNRLIIASPFLASEMTSLLGEFNFSGIKRIDLFTTIRPKDPEQIIKPPILLQFFDFFRKQHGNIELKLHINNALHGKLYLAIGGEQECLIVSSANFTRRGMTENHEWGIRSADPKLIETVMKELFDSVEYEDVTYHQIVRACQFAKQYERLHPDWVRRPNIFSDILDEIYKVEDVTNSEPKYFLKPIGTSEEPIKLEGKMNFSALHQRLYFSKKKPKGVRKGDIVITTAIGAGSLLSYFKITGSLCHVTKDELMNEPWLERWPWYLEGRNQSRQFGEEWWKHNIGRREALDEFLTMFPGIPVTVAGGFTLGTINMGNDKVLITKEFGEFLIGKIKGAVVEPPHNDPL
jgi:hypothetical protein